MHISKTSFLHTHLASLQGTPSGSTVAPVAPVAPAPQAALHLFDPPKRMKNSWWWMLLWKCHDKGLPNQLKSSSYALALSDQLQLQPSRLHQSRRQPWHWLHQWSGRKRWTRRLLQWVAATQEGMLDDFFALLSGVLGLLSSSSGVIFCFSKGCLQRFNSFDLVSRSRLDSVSIFQ